MCWATSTGCASGLTLMLVLQVLGCCARLGLLCLALCWTLGKH